VDAHWRYLGGTIQEQRAGVVGAAIFGLSWQGSAIVAPLLIRHAIDTGIRAHDRTPSRVGAGELMSRASNDELP
jgi:hypothetical protein